MLKRLRKAPPRRLELACRARSCGTMQRLLRMLVIAAFCSISDMTDPPHAESCQTPEVEIRFSSGETPPSAVQFTRQLREAIQAVCEWWGPTYDGPFHVLVNDTFRESMALVPAWSGRIGYMLFPTSMVTSGHVTTVHEVAHVFAPNANRFLAEGLAVYAQDHLKGPPAFPNFGANLNILARSYADRANLAVLDAAATPKPPRLMSTTLDAREVYIVAGSFVRFLIETYGLPEFRELYAMTPLVPGQRRPGKLDRWEKVYGLTMDELSSRWRESLDLK